MRPKRKIQMIQQKNVTIDFQINKNITAITSYSIVYFQQVSKQAKIRRTKTKNNLDKKAETIFLWGRWRESCCVSSMYKNSFFFMKCFFLLAIIIVNRDQSRLREHRQDLKLYKDSNLQLTMMHLAVWQASMKLVHQAVWPARKEEIFEQR